MLHITTEESSCHDLTLEVVRLCKSLIKKLLFEPIVSNTNTAHIKVNHLLNTLSFYILHPLPVLEHSADQCQGRHGGDGVVGLANLYGRQGDVNDRTIHKTTRQGNMVANMNHIITRQPNTSNKTINSILEDQHKNSRRCS